MTLAPMRITGLLLCALAGYASAQQDTASPDPSQTQAPAPIVRKTVKPSPTATDAAAQSAAQHPHITLSEPAPKAKSSASAKAPTGNKPATTQQTSSSGPFNRTVVVLDAAHGGVDTGSRMSDSLTEKDVTLTLAFKLRSLLNARGFTTIMTRENDEPSASPGATLTLDDRAGLANHARPLACLLIHATASGTGVHLYTSDLAPTSSESYPPPWLSAQAPWVAQSQRLAAQFAAALQRAKVPLVSNRASVRPVDSLTCPALVVELAPNAAGDTATLTDSAYQQRVAEALSGALVFWQSQAQPPPRMLPALPPAPAPSAATTSTIEGQP